MAATAPTTCSFCHSEPAEVARLFRAGKVAICDDCLRAAGRMLESIGADEAESGKVAPDQGKVKGFTQAGDFTSPRDEIFIRELQVAAHIGVPAEERSERQRLLISLALEVDSLAEAGRTDDLDLTVNYADVAERVTKLAEGSPCRLLERLGEKIATFVLLYYPRVAAVRIKIDKFILPQTASVGLSIRRERPLS